MAEVNARMCTGSYFKVLSLSKGGVSPTDKDLADRLFSIASVDTDYIGHVKDCTNNIPVELKQNFLGGGDEVLRFACNRVSDVLSSLPKKNHKKIVATMIRIIEDDDTIEDDVFLDEEGMYVKSDILKKQEIAEIEFLAWLLIFVCVNDDNPTAKRNIGVINDEYMKEALEMRSYLKLIPTPLSETHYKHNIGKLFIEQHGGNIQATEHIDTQNIYRS